MGGLPLADKIKVNRAIIVEGKYDKIKLSEIVDGLIIPTNGFSVFKDKSIVGLIKKAAEENGLIILTDSDSAGMMIRSYIRKIVNNKNIINLYIPKIEGKEKRKTVASKEGTIGVEGIDNNIIIKILSEVAEPFTEINNPITKLDLYDLGISGKDNSAELRADFERYLGLPDNLSANYLIEYLNFAFTRDEFKEVALKWQRA